MTDTGADVPSTNQAEIGSPGATATATAPAPLNLLAVVAIALAFLAPVGGVVVGFVARRDIRRTSERGDGLAFAAILVGATLALFTQVVPGVIAASSLLDMLG